ncbi:MAG: hypothetical protein ABGX27_02330 [Desulfurobacteriaceae bacterium]
MEKIDLTLLPEDARRELIDFYEFLLEKYGSKYSSRKGKNNIEDIKEILLIDKVQIDTRNWKFSREEIYEGLGNC